MTYDLESSGESRPPEAVLPRIFLREPGWRVAQKVGSEKVFCYQIAPGEDYYHRLLDGELYVFHGDEKLCLPCAERRGLVVFTSQPLRQQMAGLDVEAPAEDGGYELS